MGRTLLLGQISKQFSAIVFHSLDFSISVIIIGTRRSVVIVFNAIQLMGMHVGLKKIEGTDIMKISQLLYRIHVQTKNDSLGLVRK